MKRFIIYILFFTATYIVQAKNPIKKVFSFEEYLGYVKKHHPLVKQANLTLNVGEANRLRARGGFDPKIEIDFNTKEFKNTCRMVQ